MWFANFPHVPVIYCNWKKCWLYQSCAVVAPKGCFDARGGFHDLSGHQNTIRMQVTGGGAGMSMRGHDHSWSWIATTQKSANQGPMTPATPPSAALLICTCNAVFKMDFWKTVCDTNVLYFILNCLIKCRRNMSKPSSFRCRKSFPLYLLYSWLKSNSIPTNGETLTVLPSLVECVRHPNCHYRKV